MWISCKVKCERCKDFIRYFYCLVFRIQDTRIRTILKLPYSIATEKENSVVIFSIQLFWTLLAFCSTVLKLRLLLNIQTSGPEMVHIKMSFSIDLTKGYFKFKTLISL